MNIDVKAVAEKITGNRASSAEEFMRLEESKRSEALAYLRLKFPGTDERAFFTDYTGRVFEDVLHFRAVAEAAEIDAVCEACKNGTCRIPKALRAKNSRPVVKIVESPRGYSYLDVRWTSEFPCKFERLSGDFGRMYRKSGIKSSCQNMTFKNYQCTESTSQAKTEAMNASKTQSWLVLAGNPGTGKTHLAVAIALRAMKQGQQAIFRRVSRMLDEIQTAIRDKGDYDGLMREFETVPCLVLDDLGHENMTPARASYLHQIIDERYGDNLQTIATTNAKTPEELCRLSGEEFIAPIISRFEGCGKWVTIEGAKDFRRCGNAE